MTNSMLATAMKAAHRAAVVVLEIYATDYQVRSKNDVSPASLADEAIVAVSLATPADRVGSTVDREPESCARVKGADELDAGDKRDQ